VKQKRLVQFSTKKINVTLNPAYETPEVLTVETREGFRQSTVPLLKSGVEEDPLRGLGKLYHADIQAFVCHWIMHIPENDILVWLIVH
jgi:hypothetical protein